MIDIFNAYEYTKEFMEPHHYTIMETLLYITSSTALFSLLDAYVFRHRAGSYYAIHALCNAAIIGITIPDVIAIYTSPTQNALTQSNAIYASSLTYGLHFYHIILYRAKLRFDDYLHHSLMIFVALPLANYFGSVNLLGHSLFYTTGLPGMIDYACLYAVRNKYIHRLTEKLINRFLNTYIRNPGCTIHAFITLITVIQSPDMSLINTIIAFITSMLVFWNGVYFMDQVVGNYYIQNNEQRQTLPKNYDD